MRDFTIQSYKILLQSLQQQGFSFHTFAQFLEQHKEKTMVLRHDVDKLPVNSLVTAELEHTLGIKGTYYFRAVPCSWNEEIIKQIAALGHEVGYHYENLTVCKGNVNKAYDDFRKNLDKLKRLVPVTTICMHGSPMSKWDSRDIWKEYDYHALDIIGEPYFDLDFSKVFYLTDTGRRWNGAKYSVRDKPVNPNELTSQYNNRTAFPSYRSTSDIIKSIHDGSFPQLTMMTIHPQRWTDNKFLWAKELINQNIKNVTKYFLMKLR